MKYILYVLFLSSSIFSQNFSSYFSLKIGNKYFYYCTNEVVQSPFHGTSADKMKNTIDDTISYAGKKYYHYTRELIRISGTCNFRTFSFPFDIGNYNLLRLDTLTGKIYYYNLGLGCSYSPDENMIDSLNSKLNDIVYVITCGPAGFTYNLTCIDTAGTRKFSSGSEKVREYKRNIGLLKNRCNLFITGGYLVDEQTLTGSVINGIVSGDTSFGPISVVNIINTDIPQFCSLSQNYPNPFNPVTKIKFDISGSSETYTLLSVYDATGKEVQILVNQHLQPGTYEADWDASAYPSGVYYYRIAIQSDKLESGDFTETRKMVLIK